MIDETSYKIILGEFKRNNKILKAEKPKLLDFKILRIGRNFKINYSWSLEELPIVRIISIDNSFVSGPPKPTSNYSGIVNFKTFCCLITTKYCFEDSLIREKELGEKLIQIFKTGKNKIDGHDYLNKKYEVETNEEFKFINWIVTYNIEEIFKSYPESEIEFKQNELLIYFNQALQDYSQIQRLVNIAKLLKNKNAI